MMMMMMIDDGDDDYYYYYYSVPESGIRSRRGELRVPLSYQR